ncbi:MAG: phospholipid scramblase-related protein [Pseudomonadota bacterium]
MELLDAVNGLVISQKKEWGEIFTGFETKNKYMVLDSTGSELYMAVEEGGSLLSRWFLRALRPFEINVCRFDKQLVIRVVRPFRFYFHELNVYDATGKLLGTIKREFAFLRRIYSLFDPNGTKIFQMFGPIFHPWTFHIKDDSLEHGKITKKWSGLLKEGFTDADVFGITFPNDWPNEQKALFLGAVFLIDFVHFENKGRN